MIYFTADNHLDRALWKVVPELEGDSFRALDALVDAVIADPTKEPKYLVFAGDILNHRYIDGVGLAAIKKALDKLAEAGVGTLFIQGNHDRDILSIPEAEGMVSLNEKAYRLDGRTVAGIDYCPREQLLLRLLTKPAADILILHVKMESFLHFEGVYDLTWDEVPTKFKHVVVGDVHVSKLEEFGDRWLLSPGATVSCKIDEVGDKGFWKLPAHAGQPFFVPFKAQRPILRLVVETDEALAAVAAEIEEALHDDAVLPPVVEIRYAPELADAVATFVKKCPEAIFVTDTIRTSKLLDSVPEQKGDMLTLKTALPLAVDKDKQSEVYDLLHSLLHGNAQEIVERRKKLVLESLDA